MLIIRYQDNEFSLAYDFLSMGEKKYALIDLAVGQHLDTYVKDAH